MECFNDLLHKLREVHEREVEGWQGKVQELSNKKGCDSKRMEELFTRNQQMKEQQRLLTENIKTLENRLRAGLCDRCTVTQEVAKRRQQEFEASQIQSLQHISLLAGEMNNLKKENKRLRDEIRNLRAALDRGPVNHSSSSTSEVKPNGSPELSPPSSGPVALVSNPATSRAANRPADGDVAVKSEAEQRSEEAERRQQRGTNRSHLESYQPLPLSPLASPAWKVEHNTTRERRSQVIEVLDQRSSIPPPAHLKTSSSSSPGGDVKPSRHVLHAPVPCRPHLTKNSPVTLPWPLSESSDWVNVAAAGANPLVQTPPKLNLPRFPNLIPTSQQASLRRPGFGSPWQKQNSPHPSSKEPTVVFRLRGLTEFAESQTKPPEKKESPSLKAERVSGEALDGPLDLSDRGKSKPSQTAREDSPLALQGGAKLQTSPDRDINPPVSTPSPVFSPSSSCTTPVKQESSSDHNHKVKEEQSEEVNGKTEQSSRKKVPVLTISLRPVVVLETLNSALQKQESLSSNGKATEGSRANTATSSFPEDEPESNSEQDEDESSSGRESSRSCKRKRTSVETETDGDSDSGNRNQQGKIKSQ